MNYRLAVLFLVALPLSASAEVGSAPSSNMAIAERAYAEATAASGQGDGSRALGALERMDEVLAMEGKTPADLKDKPSPGSIMRVRNEAHAQKALYWLGAIRRSANSELDGASGLDSALEIFLREQRESGRSLEAFKTSSKELVKLKRKADLSMARYWLGHWRKSKSELELGFMRRLLATAEAPSASVIGATPAEIKIIGPVSLSEPRVGLGQGEVSETATMAIN